MDFVFKTYSVVDEGIFLKNVELAHKRQLPNPVMKKRPPLAIVGGGPSANRYVERLRNWKGDIWVIGSAYPWAVENGIKATFFNVDPLPEQADYAKGAKHAILASQCHPSVFDAVKNAECFDIVTEQENINCGATAVTATPCLALEMGYTAVVYFGCESSFDKTTHAYDYENPHSPLLGIWVRCNEQVFPTTPAFLMQAQVMADTFRRCPLVFRDMSGGLLGAMMIDPDFEIIAVDQDTHDLMTFELNGEQLSREEGRKRLPILGMQI